MLIDSDCRCWWWICWLWADCNVNNPEKEDGGEKNLPWQLIGLRVTFGKKEKGKIKKSSRLPRPKNCQLCNKLQDPFWEEDSSLAGPLLFLLHAAGKGPSIFMLEWRASTQRQRKLSRQVKMCSPVCVGELTTTLCCCRSIHKSGTACFELQRRCLALLTLKLTSTLKIRDFFFFFCQTRIHRLLLCAWPHAALGRRA